MTLVRPVRLIVDDASNVAPAHPVTCADFSGKKVSFFYPLNGKSNPPQLKGTAILIYGEDGGTADKQGFTGPLPPAAFMGCGLSTPQSIHAQTVTSLPASGIAVTSP